MFNNWFVHGRTAHSELFLPQAAMRREMQRERSRCDRRGGYFSLLCIDVRRLSSEEREALPVLIESRLRSTDTAGMLDGHRIGIVLPDTDAEGAWTLAADLKERIGDMADLFDMEVYRYPNLSSELSEKDDARSPAYLPQGARPMELLFAQPLPAWKRGLDIAGALVGLSLALPVMLGAASLIKLTSRGPIFFRQQRAGLGGKPFSIYKFRTMCVDAEAKQGELITQSHQDGPAFKLARDPRVTPIGRLLRKTSLDELPQLFNVLFGQMSLVGPRPLPCHESDACDGWQRERLNVTPGITCTWQIHGRSRVTFAEWARMDLRYSRTRSPSQDINLILKTVPAVLSQRGAH